MKLRNKKTGEVVDFKIIADYDDCTSGWRLEKQDGSVLFYDHVDEIREEWEDYTPKEPLIKDEKIRKAVRAWAELSGVDKCHFEHNDGSFASKWYGISLPTSKYGEDIESGFYTIDELCGEGDDD